MSQPTVARIRKQYDEQGLVVRGSGPVPAFMMVPVCQQDFARSSAALPTSPPSAALYHPGPAPQIVTGLRRRSEGGIGHGSAVCSVGAVTAVDVWLRCGYRD